jgi:hypothetical protein
VGDFDRAVFIGLPGSSSRPLRTYAAPKDAIELPPEAKALYKAMEAAEAAASKKGDREEDGAPGYRLSKDPDARAAELRLREYAMRHEAELIRVLKAAADPRERNLAADMLGYANRSSRQIAAFVRAARDPNDGVRNSATRALGEILRADRTVAALVPAGPYIDMIRSGIWTDRNKSDEILDALAASGNTKLLQRLRAEAWDALLEMADWRESGWSMTARMILARLAGIPEQRLLDLINAPLAEFRAALAKR